MSRPIPISKRLSNRSIDSGTPPSLNSSGSRSKRKELIIAASSSPMRPGGSPGAPSKRSHGDRSNRPNFGAQSRSMSNNNITIPSSSSGSGRVSAIKGSSGARGKLARHSSDSALSRRTSGRTSDSENTRRSGASGKRRKGQGSALAGNRESRESFESAGSRGSHKARGAVAGSGGSKVNRAAARKMKILAHPDLLRNVFQRLERDDWFNLKLTCKFFNEFLNSYDDFSAAFPEVKRVRFNTAENQTIDFTRGEQEGEIPAWMEPSACSLM